MVLNLGSRRALRDDQRRNQRQWPTWPEAVRSSTCVGSVLGRMAHGRTNRARKTGLDKAVLTDMTVADHCALAQRAHNTNIDSKTHNPGSVPRPTIWGRSPGNGMNQRDSMGSLLAGELG